MSEETQNSETQNSEIQNSETQNSETQSSQEQTRLPQKKVMKLSVRSLVEFVMRGGDIDNRRASGAEKEAMQEGSRIHRKIQKRMGADYRAEVSMKHTVEEEGYQLLIEGRADGVIENPAGVTIDEIKGIYLDLMRLEEPIPVHLAQALCYGYFVHYYYIQGFQHQSFQL